MATFAELSANPGADPSVMGESPMLDLSDQDAVKSGISQASLETQPSSTRNGSGLVH